jgi:hypothetical protein
MKKHMGPISSDPQTLQEAIIFYADEENCTNQMIAIRWKNGVCCPRCGDFDVTMHIPLESEH